MTIAKDIRPLTSLRFFAAMWVVLYHYWPNLSATMPAVVGKGYLGVELFFTLSGFILSLVYLDAVGRAQLPLRRLPVGAAGAGLSAAHRHPGRGRGHGPGGRGRRPRHRRQRPVLAVAAGQSADGPRLGPLAGGGLESPLLVDLGRMVRLSQLPAVRLAGVKAEVAALAGGGGGARRALRRCMRRFERLAGFPLTHATIAWGALRIVPCFALGCAINLLWRATPLTEPPLRRPRRRIFQAPPLLAAAQFGAPDVLLVALFGA